jgi:hypothetical protein
MSSDLLGPVTMMMWTETAALGRRGNDQSNREEDNEKDDYLG